VQPTNYLAPARRKVEQASIGKIGLHGYLNKIKRADDPWYGYEQAYQIVRHIIKDYECLKDIRFRYLGIDFIRDTRVFLRDPELTPKTI
jgi:hypothetical protein